ncbi:oxalate decarboxylase/phosphoglucose isomerase-like protein (cupin superfamily) [Lipingzhangella halophila]|uniref:Oxalate decarboxylase/phosphoglucose isomerase-like protein (Cupin superfamily) n=1 Tax=Lipingzhangella halophila TaxID=1783352 RepID=A0A7W7W1Y2_9ACTN|nr:cupin domain-containing protein [Lipingzhangella halophila]MBB4931156.1 oxalate decarboxylase/phosphoglucose isomerase-like protein (cupin superfamily) [Lipingzhangella halophila]
MRLAAVDPHSRETMTFDWGSAKWYVQPDSIPGAGLSFGEVVLNPGRGHDRHNHPESEEVLYVLSGTGRQMLNDEEPFDVSPGDVIYVPRGMFHSTVNTGWTPMRLIAVYNPGGEEAALRQLPDFAALPAGEVPQLRRD